MRHIWTAFSFDENTMDLLAYLKIKIGAKSKAEVIRRAIALLALAVEFSGNGKNFYIINDNDVRQKIIL